MYSLQLWIAVAILAWISFLWSRRRFYLLMLRVKGPIGYPIIGNSLQYLRTKCNMNLRAKYNQEYGPTNLCWLGMLPVLTTCEPNIVQDILTSPHCLGKTQVVCTALTTNVGPGVVSLNGSHWLERRKQMSPAFKQNVLMSFLPIFNEETKSLLSLLNTFVGQGERDILPELLNCSFRTSIQSTMGSHAMENPSFKNGTLLTHFHHVLEATTQAIMFSWIHNTIIAKLVGIEKRRTEAVFGMSEPIKSIIKENMTNKPEESQSRNTVINRVVEFLKSGEFTLEDAKGECCLMVAAAFETSAITIFSTLTLLAMFPEYQDAAFEELKDVFPNVGDFDVSYEDLQKLVYLDRVWNESMRLLPPVPFFPRVTAEDLQLSNGILVPKGVTVAADIFNIHRNKDAWGPGADKFNPDNFLPENIQKRHPYAFIPFNKGKRNCIGWKYAEISTKITLAKILRNFRLSTSFRFEDLSFIDNIVLKYQEQPLLEVQRR